MVSTILLSGGVGSRTGKNIPKQYCKLLGKEIISYCIESIINAGLKDELVIVYGKGFKSLLEEILEPFRNNFSTIKLIPGGETRQDSVFNGLKECSGDRVLLHESARPLITSEDILKILNFNAEAATTGIPIPFTVLKKSDNLISEVLNREDLFNVQLPQVFPLKKLIEAHKLANNDNRSFTDDSSLYFTYIGDVGVVEGLTENIKITDSKDFPIAEEIIRRRCGN